MNKRIHYEYKLHFYRLIKSFDYAIKEYTNMFSFIVTFEFKFGQDIDLVSLLTFIHQNKKF